MKTATVQTRMEPKLKKEVEAILAKIGLSSSEAISLYFNSIKRHNGIPFELKIPKKSVQKAMRDAELGRNLTRFKKWCGFNRSAFNKALKCHRATRFSQMDLRETIALWRGAARICKSWPSWSTYC